jgi:acyl-homoserine-lactone acylase
VTWGEINKVQVGDREYPSNGAEGYFGVFRVAWHNDIDSDKKYENIGGDSFYGLVEFSDPIKAEVLLPYGNSSQPGSPHMGDQLELYSNKKLRPVWFTYSEVEEHLEYREILSQLNEQVK